MTEILTRTLLIFFVLFLSVMSLHAHESDTLYNVVNIDASADSEIPNDQMTVVLVSSHDGSDATAVSGQVNKDMAWALSLVKAEKNISSKTTSYQTFPIYDKQVITGWRSSQSLELKSTEIDSLSDMIGNLQKKLKVQQMYFSPTDKTRKEFENQLIAEAMEAFKQRIAIVGEHMPHKNHKILNININTGGNTPPIMNQRAAMAKSMAMEASAPAVEAGTSRITVTINGSVQFF